MSIVEQCRTARPDILLVAFGNPKQEKWIYAHAAQLKVPVMMGVGGTFDFIAGVTKRAPLWMQQSGLEWLYRLLSDPRRLWKRYATDLLGFGYFFLWQWWVMQRGTVRQAILPKADFLIVKDTVIMNVQGHLDSSNQHAFAEKANQTISTHPYLIINLANAQFLDSSAIGTLVALTKQARDDGGNLWLANVPATIVNVLTLLRLDQFFDICEDVDSALQTRGMTARMTVPALGQHLIPGDVV
jgi:N-acetylglucosaminyldiphosphoundecaprenol N-acetyl-beta-D-mannosaminyltransferase